MTETTNNDFVCLSTYQGREENLNFYTYAKSDPQYQDFLKIKKEIEDKLAAGDPVYVAFHDERREHSVGRLKSITIKTTEHPRSSSWSYTGRSESYVYVSVEDVEVVWDGRSNKVRPRPSEIVYWPDWQHGTQWYWEQPTKPKEEPVIAYDHLGQELEIGQNVCFVHRYYGMTSMKFGTVTRFTNKGSVFIKTMKLRDGEEAGEELKALSMEDVIIINDTLMKRIVMAKLSAN